MKRVRHFLTVNRIASMLGIHHVTAKKLVETFAVTPVNIGQRTLYRAADVLPRLQALLQQD